MNKVVTPSEGTELTLGYARTGSQVCPTPKPKSLTGKSLGVRRSGLHQVGGDKTII